MIFFLKNILEIGLGGKAQIFADLTDGFFRVSQQAFSFLQFSPHNKITQIKSQFFFKLL